MYIANILESLMVNTDTNYSPELNDAINMHNGSVTSFAQGITTTAILSLLIEKNIITDDEFIAKLDGYLNVRRMNVDHLTYNRDVLLKCMEDEKEYMNQVKAMHEDIATPVHINNQETDVSDTNVMTEN